MWETKRRRRRILRNRDERDIDRETYRHQETKRKEHSYERRRETKKGKERHRE